MPIGKVYLVGAGPGDPGLLTLKGRACLERADLVLYDGLVNPSLLRHARAVAERTGRVQGPDGKHLKQEQINQRLVEAGLAGKTVVRLKGGDPYIFGRGTEEAEALRAAGVPFEVVPGVTAATAAGEYAGVSVTHRRLASAVAFVTGHEDPAKPAMLDYAALAKFPGTLVFYMGLKRLSSIAERLIANGLSKTTPACVVSRASRARQKTVTGTLNEIADRVHESGLVAPSLTIIGDCATQRESLQWFELNPLFGQRIAVTRAVDQAEPTVERIHELGGEAVLAPLLEVCGVPAFEQLQNLDQFRWIAFTSANGIRFFMEQLQALDLDARALGKMKIAVVGQATAEVLTEYALRADVIAEHQNAEGLAEALVEAGASRRVIWPCGSRARRTLVEKLADHKIECCPIVVYESNDVAISDSVRHEIEAGTVDWIPVASPAMAKHLASINVPPTTRIATISPLTSAAARAAGFGVSAEASDYSWNGIVDAILASHSPEATE
ncbi:MAG: uroporphyrinogen-III C-methyltransferase [Planctomycetaceae bacterium]